MHILHHKFLYVAVLLLLTLLGRNVANKILHSKYSAGSQKQLNTKLFYKIIVSVTVLVCFQ